MIQSVIHIDAAFCLLQHCCHIRCKRLQRIQIITFNLNRQSLSEKCGVVHRRRGNSHFHIHIIGEFGNLLADTLGPDIRILIQKDVHADGIGSPAHQAHGRTASNHGTDGFNALDIRNAIDHFVGSLRQFLKGLSLILFCTDSHRNLIGFHIHIHEGHTSGKCKYHAASKKDNGQHEYQRLEAQTSTQDSSIPVLEFFKPRMANLPCFTQSR